MLQKLDDKNQLFSRMVTMAYRHGFTILAAVIFGANFPAEKLTEKAQYALRERPFRQVAYHTLSDDETDTVLCSDDDETVSLTSVKFS